MNQTANTDRERMPIATTRTPSDREIVQERTFDAPRELVWKAWTDPKHVDAWWGPNGYRNETASMDFRVGGTWRFVMHGPDGKDWQNWIRYLAITENERLEYDHGGGESDTPHFHVTVTFASVGSKTKVTMASIFPSAEVCAAVKKNVRAMEGGAQTLARLAGHLPALADGTFARAMVLTRVFSAPASRVFEAWTKPELLAKWWGPKNFSLPVCEVDFRVGGAYRMTMRGPDGQDYPFHGEYREIVPGRRLAFSGIIDHLRNVSVETVVTFVEEGAQTRVTVTQTFPSDAMAANGQREGWSGSLEKLGEMLTA